MHAGGIPEIAEEICKSVLAHSTAGAENWDVANYLRTVAVLLCYCATALALDAAKDLSQDTAREQFPKYGIQ